MVKLINNCVDCKDLGLPCLGNSCPNKSVYIEFCDECDKHADCYIDGRAYCEKCAKEYLVEVFKDLTIREMADLLQMTYYQID